MAEDKKNGFPTIPAANWFALREKFNQRVPSEINPSYLASALSMTTASAGANVLPALKALGIVGDDGKPTELAYDWRDDDKYKDVCGKIIKNVYPQSLQDLFHDASASLDSLKSWFMRTAKVGESAAMKFARTYLMLLQADVKQAKDTTSNNAKPKSAVISKPQKETIKTTKKVEEQMVEAVNDNARISSSLTPSLHIDIQIHISPDSSADQIDKIFESMAKHLKGFKA